ncbi:hypothetical protein INR49_023178 [Caranx melampygus]|nr:hypothetical protein INR49_023178 [Caranx melampygus]
MTSHTGGESQRQRLPAKPVTSLLIHRMLSCPLESLTTPFVAGYECPLDGNPAPITYKLNLGSEATFSTEPFREDSSSMFAEEVQ